MLSPRIDHQIRLNGQRNFGLVPMFDFDDFDTSTTSKTLKIRPFKKKKFILNIFFKFYFIWVWPSHCRNMVVTCQYVPDTVNLKKKEKEKEKEKKAEF